MTTTTPTPFNSSPHILSETSLSLSAAARLMPKRRNNRPTHPSTLARWITEGVLLPDGSRVRLEATRLCGKWITSLEALQRFADRQTPQLSADPDAPAPRGPAERQRAAEAAGRELDRIGIRTPKRKPHATKRAS